MDNPIPFNPSMLMIAREARALSQNQLATQLEVHPGTVSRLESGLRECSEGMLERLARALDYPEEFFLQTDSVIGFGLSELFHRKYKTLPKKTLDRIHGQINIYRMHVNRMLRGADIGDVTIPRIDIDEFTGGTEDIARVVRAQWCLPHGPIQNVTDVIERAGGIVVPFDFGTRQVDAISQWDWRLSSPPLFFVNMRSPGDRLRFTLCHELGHVIMHQETANENMEAEANLFAAEFLMPAKDIFPFLGDISLAKLASLKPYWKVSMSALLRRARSLGKISERRERQLFTQLNRSGYQTREPVELDIPVERPILFPNLLRVHTTDMQFGLDELAKLFSLHEHELRRMYFSDPPYLSVVA